MQPPDGPNHFRFRRFQSSSGQKAGCNPPTTYPLAVSILIRPEGRMQPQLSQRRGGRWRSLCVSILIRPEGRMQPLACWNVDVRIACNSGTVSILIRPEGRMQRPHFGHIVAVFAQGVSILIRPEGRMQPAVDRRAGAAERFQSSSGQKAGCNRRRQEHAWQFGHCFNPHPARRPDATPAVLSVGERSDRFNPHPARRPDAIMWALPVIAQWLYVFQSSSGQKAGCNLC